MIERDFGQRSGLKISPVNIGAMRLPKDTGDAVALVRHAIDGGMRYIDASRGYGDSEWVVGRALKDGYRDKVILSTKWSPWIMKPRPDDGPTAACTRRRVEEALMRLDVDYVDFFQIWDVLDLKFWEQAIAPGGMVDGLLGAKEDGLVRHLGFSYHCPAEKLADCIDQADWCESIMSGYHLLWQARGPSIEAAHRRGVGTLTMNPVAGGALGEDTPVLLELAREVGAVSVADLAVRFVLSNPHIDGILCGMKKMSDVDDTIASAERPTFTEEQLARIQEFLDELSPGNVGFCTTCKYCMPCPQGINIPRIMSAIYQDRVLKLKDGSRATYRIAGGNADACIRCGQCEEKCTQKLNIMDELEGAAAKFGGQSAHAGAQGHGA